MQVLIPASLTQEHKQVLATYLTDDRLLRSADWAKIYEAIGLLKDARIVRQNRTWRFRQIYNQQIDRSFADLYLEKLLSLDDVPKQSPALIAMFGRRIEPYLERVGFLDQYVFENWLLRAYCVYWWQSFARGYAFEVEVIRDLEANGVVFQAHDLRRRKARYSKADLKVLGLDGDIKTSTYFLKFQPFRDLTNDFYITRLYEKKRQRTLVVLQKPIAWQTINGEVLYESKLEDLLKILPNPVRLQQKNTTLVVIEYDFWKQKVLKIQQDEGAEDVPPRIT